MNSIYGYLDYKDYINHWVLSQAGGGYGIYQKISKKIRIHRSTVSQVFSGDKHLTLEQASELSDFIGLKADEAYYFLNLVSYGRAGSEHLRYRLEQVLKEQQRKNTQSPHENAANKLESSLKSDFYLNWQYAAVSVLKTVPRFKKLENIAGHLKLPARAVNEALSFLKKLESVEQNPGRRASTQQTYLPPNSPVIDVHRTHWRLQAIQRFPDLQPDEISFSAPLSISEKDFLKVKNELRLFIEGIYKRVKDTEPETGVILNIDWVRL